MAADPDTLLYSDLPFPVRRGKVRDVYDLGDSLVIVATDRISAFDYVLPTAIPGKGRVLTALTLTWLARLAEPNHLLDTDPTAWGEPFSTLAEILFGRSMRVRKTEVIPVECVVRGYLAGSAWKEYRRSGAVCGVALPAGLRESERLAEPIFTPTTKADVGHDENISFAEMADRVGSDTATELRQRTVAVYQRAADFAAGRGLIVADTKLEWGRLPDGRLILIDEVLTPDSSRFWPADAWRPGTSPPSFDKQFVRDWLDRSDWDKESPPPPLPAEIVEQTRQRYEEALQRLAT